MHPAIPRPDNSEFASYYVTYVDATANTLVASGKSDICDLLNDQCDALEQLVRGVPDDQANMGYAPGKWSLKESIVHVCDAERIFSYRALRIGRGDETPLASFEQDGYVPESRANNRTMTDILAEFRAIRASTMALINSFDENALARMGTASGQPVSARALCWIVAGHVAHHINLTRDRYLPALATPK